MSKKLKVQSEILVKVEEVMLSGISKPYRIARAVPELKGDWRIGRIYQQAVEAMWRARNINPEDIRKELFQKAKAREEYLSLREKEAVSPAVKINYSKLGLDVLRFQQSLAGLESQHLILSKEENPYQNLSDEELNRANYESFKYYLKQNLKLALPTYEQFIKHLTKRFRLALPRATETK